jgi:hypothetical protein
VLAVLVAFDLLLTLAVALALRLLSGNDTHRGPTTTTEKPAPR